MLPVSKELRILFQYKISFALDLANPETWEKKHSESGTNDIPSEKEKGKNGKVGDGMKDTGGKGDEADAGRTTVSYDHSNIPL